MAFSTIPEMFLTITEKFKAQKTAMMYKKDGIYLSFNHSEIREKVECLAIGLLDLGIHSNDRIGFVSENRWEWMVASFAITCIGAVDVPVFPTLSAKQEEYIFGNCDVAAIVVSNKFQLQKVLQFKDSIPSIRHIIVMGDEVHSSDLSVKSLSSLIKRGSEIRSAEERKTIFEEHCLKVQTDDLLTLIYTSGTTGNPKGVILTHKNICSNIEGALERIKFTSEDILLSYLPWCHAFERTAGFYCIFATGATVALAESLETVAANIREVQPTLLTTVPRLLEVVKKKIYSEIEKSSTAKQKVFNWAIDAGKNYFNKKFEGKSSIYSSAKNIIADKLVFSKLKEKLGGRMKLILSGGAALPEEIALFFNAAGLTVIQGYGLTEASPVVTINSEDDNEIGTIGKPIFNVEVKIAADGEILARGPNIMKGYWNDFVATRDSINSEGWLLTGDIGTYTKKGNIKITDRKKNLFVSSGGKNIAPQPIENLISQSKYVDHVLLVGDRREYCTALISPNIAELNNLAQKLGLEDMDIKELVTDKKIVYEIHKDIDTLQKDLAKFERVRRFQILSIPLSVDGGELSPKMNIKRHVVEKKYEDLIEAMYGEG
ncbi:MAG: long-chain fatty acid--CoA ligase [Candidatus Kapabacteria bacterium]|nr:long-chain fatty acid--CoA ligase [Candidatus Kapabacteria bacterium]